jgi:hypothetical protein
MNLIVNNKLDKAMTPEQFTQVVDAILEDKYSWACVLILRFAGYNPLHYIPYRTYNRLMKDNSKDCHKRRPSEALSFQNQQTTEQNSQKAHQIQDLAYLESLKQPQNLIKGGYYSPAYSRAFSGLEYLNFKL